MAGVCEWLKGVCDGGIHGRGVCMAEGMHGRRCMPHKPPGRYYDIRSISGWYASYWNAFLSRIKIYLAVFVFVLLSMYA